MIMLRRVFTALRKHRNLPAAGCDACAFVHFFRSNGDGQAARLQAFCRCPGGPFENRPIPRERWCSSWQAAPGPVEKPQVGDPNLTV